MDFLFREACCGVPVWAVAIPLLYIAYIINWAIIRKVLTDDTHVVDTLPLRLKKIATLRRPIENYRDVKKIEYPDYNFEGPCFVTGGSGFLGQNLVEALVKKGYKVTVFDIREGQPMENVTFIKGNLVDRHTLFEETVQSEVVEAMAGHKVVFHCASPNPNSTNRELLYNVNVIGTENVVHACRTHGIEKLVFTSSASVVYAGNDQSDADENLPYPAVFRDAYCETKAQAEQHVLDAGRDSGSSLATIAIRPHGIFGAHDPQLVPTLVDVAKQGRNKWQIGAGDNLVDFTYVGNVVHSHLLAAENATPLARDPTRRRSGQVYFITNDEPIRFWQFLGRILVGLGYKPPSFRLPYRFLLTMATVVEGIVAALSVITGKRPALTFSRSRVQLAGTHHYYNCGKAAREMKYKPLWSVEEGLWITLQSFQHLKNPTPQARYTLRDPESSSSKPVPSAARSGAGGDTLKKRERTFTREEVAKHTTDTDAWVIIDGGVYDVTPYLDAHPGGDAIMRNLGGDNTEGFHRGQHPQSAFTTREEFRIGRLADE